MKNKQTTILIVLISAVVFVMYQRRRLQKAVANLAAYILKASPDWKNEIMAKSKKNNITFEQQLLADTQYSVKNDPKYKMWAWLI